MAERVAEFAIARIWPLFDPQSDERSSPLTQRVLADARTALGAEPVQVLAQSAALHRELESLLVSFRVRRGCGSWVEVLNVPWHGLALSSRQALHRAVMRNESKKCRKVTRADEQHALELSAALRNRPEVSDALSRLSAWVVRAVAAHEARHAADLRGPRDCASCGELSYAQRSELSAYLAAMGSPGMSYLALYQACESGVHDGSANGIAVRMLESHLLPGGCQADPGADLTERARALEKELFGQATTIRVPESFPSRLPLPEPLE